MTEAKRTLAFALLQGPDEGGGKAMTGGARL
jgi:hypothetical protein